MKAMQVCVRDRRRSRSLAREPCPPRIPVATRMHRRAACSSLFLLTPAISCRLRTDLARRFGGLASWGLSGVMGGALETTLFLPGHLP